MERDRFLSLFDAALKQAGLVMTYDPDDQLAGRIEEPQATVNLHNILRHCSTVSEAEAVRTIDDFVADLRRSGQRFPDHWHDVRNDVLPILRDKASMHISILAHRAPKGEDRYEIYPHRDFGPDLMAMVAVDSETSIAMPSSPTLDTWGISFDEAFEVGLANLAQRDSAGYQDLGNGCYAWINGNDYESSRLLLPSFWQALPRLDGDPVVICPAKDAILLAGSGNPEGLAELAHQAAGIIEECRPLSGFASVRRQGGVERFPGSDDVGAEAIASLGRNWQITQYAEQKKILIELLERRSLDLFVAGYQVLRGHPDIDGERSFATWTEDVHTWLPEVEYVFFRADNDDTLFAPWSSVRAVMGERMRLLDYLPPRYEVAGFPSPEQFAAMGARQLQLKKRKQGLRRLWPW